MDAQKLSMEITREKADFVIQHAISGTSNMHIISKLRALWRRAALPSDLCVDPLKGLPKELRADIPAWREPPQCGCVPKG